MKVILKADIKGVGKKDQVINASDGYARNYLFPKKLKNTIYFLLFLFRYYQIL